MRIELAGEFVFYQAAEWANMESRNRVATELVDEAIDFADELGIAIHHLDNDAVVLDFGVDARGGIEAGLLLTEIATGGLATVQTRLAGVAGASVPIVELTTDHPSLALQAAQLADWPFEEWAGRGYGPANLFTDVRRVETGYTEEFDFAVLAIEAAHLPDEGVAGSVASTAGLGTSGVFLPTASAASVAGSVSILAEAAGRAVSGLAEVGYDLTSVISATGSAPMVPFGADGETARTRAETAIAAAGRAHLLVTEPLDGGQNIEEQLGDPDLPAALTIDVVGGPIHVYGEADESALTHFFD